ncbi:type II toxin-antitoxin system VapC family toxin [Thermococcus sp.]|uniref:type II toxin-antitoxin system VapC family toxin n=1 Tax=Thermococcus sp. TaxID=35749 RepID=UPI00262C4E49|nr:type II toxin-antitoxin system VapC family toxin [Thermococcus sp.]
MSGEERGFVIDTNVIVGAFFYGSDYPQLRGSKSILSKCRLVLKLVRGKNVAVPRVAVVESISVVKRISGDRELAIRLGNAIENSFEVVPEEMFYKVAKDIASDTSPSGFDTYFLALSKSREYRLVTRDRALCTHARRVNVECLLIDESIGESEINAFMGG